MNRSAPTMLRNLGVCILAMMLVATLVTLVPTVARAATTDDTAGHKADVTWGVRTASLDLGADRQNYAYTAEPGERVVDAIVVTNHDREPLELNLYAADAFTTDAGELDVVTRDAESTHLGAWVELAADHVRLEPGESLQVDFAVTVPKNAEPGDHAGAVVTSLADAEADGVTVDRRLGIRIHLRVAGDLLPAMAVEDLRVDHQSSLNPFESEQTTVSYTVRNVGNVRLAADQAVNVNGPFGVARVAAADLASVPELLPGETWEVTAAVDGVRPLVRLTAAVTLDPRMPEGVDGATAVEQVRATRDAWAVPWSVLGLLAVVVGGVLLLRQVRARRQRAEEGRVQDAVAQALREREARDGATARVDA